MTGDFQCRRNTNPLLSLPTQSGPPTKAAPPGAAAPLPAATARSPTCGRRRRRRPPPGARPRSSRINRVAWHPSDPDTLAAVGDDAPVRVWDARGAALKGTAPSGVVAAPAAGAPPPASTPAAPAVNIALAWNPVHTHLLAVASDADAVTGVDLGGGSGGGAPRVAARLPPPGVEVNDVAWSADGSLLFRARGDGAVDAFAWPELGSGWSTPTPIARLQGHTSTVFALATSPGGLHLASGGADAAAIVWDLRWHAPLASVGAIDQPIKSVAFGGGGGGGASSNSPSAPTTASGASLLAYGGDGDAIAVDVWDAPPGDAKPPPFLVPLRARVEQLAWCPASSSARGGGLAFTGPLYAGARGDVHGAVGLLAPP